MKRKISSLVILMTAMLCLSGCSGSEKGQEEPETAAENQLDAEKNAAVENDPEAENPVNGDDLFEGAAASGDIKEISDGQCVLNETWEEGEMPVSTAPSTEGEEDKTHWRTVVYGEGCIFQKAEITVGSPKITYGMMEETELKAGDNIAVYGSYGEDGQLYAERIYVYTFI